MASGAHGPGKEKTGGEQKRYYHSVMRCLGALRYNRTGRVDSKILLTKLNSLPILCF